MHVWDCQVIEDGMPLVILAGSCEAERVSSTLGNEHRTTNGCSKFTGYEENFQERTTTPSV